jgi:hypothetical protein
MQGMTERSEPKRRATAYKIRGPNTWAAAREMFQAGAAASVVAETFDVGISNLHRRAREEGWRKRDLPDLPDRPSVPGEESAAAGALPVDVRGAAVAAMSQAARLMTQGQFARATEAMKAAEMFGKLAERLPVSPVAEADDATVLDDLRRKIIALSSGTITDVEDDGEKVRGTSAA